MKPESWDVERRADGAVLVRVHSAEREGGRLPDAVFTFRRGDPQFEHWEAQWRLRQPMMPTSWSEGLAASAAGIACAACGANDAG